MKIVIVVLCLLVLPLALRALDLQTAARKERERRKALAAAGPVSTRYTDRDLERYAHRRAEGLAGVRPSGTLPPKESKAPEPSPSRDLEAEKAFWRKESERHRREVARLDARIRRLEWRLTQARSRQRPGGGIREDPALTLLAESVQALVDERRLLEETFRERARRAGAFPGWLR